jgi:DNA-directed RNA polymerase II subunit RPB2
MAELKEKSATIIQKAYRMYKRTTVTEWNWNEDFKNYFYDDNIRSLINLHHINSFNDFIENKIKKILTKPVEGETNESGINYLRTKNFPLNVTIEFDPDTIRFECLKYTDVSDTGDTIEKEYELTPNLCINKNIDYKGKLIVDININCEYGEDFVNSYKFNLKNIKLCELPLMVYSNECSLYKNIKKFISYKYLNQDELNNRLDELNVIKESLKHLIGPDRKEKLEEINDIEKQVNIAKNIKEKNEKFKNILDMCEFGEIEIDKTIEDKIKDLSEKDQYEKIDRIKKYILYENNENIYEYGGYFIIKGKEKVLVSQDRLCNNKLYIKKDRIGIDSNNKTEYNYVCEIKSVEIEEQDFKPAKTTYIKIKKNKFTTFPKFWKTDDKYIDNYCLKISNIYSEIIQFLEEKIETLFDITEDKLGKKTYKLKEINELLIIIETNINNYKEELKQDPTNEDNQKILESLIFLQEKKNEEKDNEDSKVNEVIIKKDLIKDGASNEEIEEFLDGKMRESEQGFEKESRLKSDEYFSIFVSFKDLKNDIPIYIIFRALGYESDKEIFEYISGSINPKMDSYKYELFYNIINNCRYDAIKNGIYTQKQALLYIYDNLNDIYKNENFQIKNKIITVYRKLKYNFLPHCNADSNNKKILFFSYCIESLLYVYFGYENITDRDTYKFKRIDSSGKLLSSLFRDFYINLIKHFRTLFSKLGTKNQIESFIKRLYGEHDDETQKKEKNNNFEQYLIHEDQKKKSLNDIITEGFRRSFKGNWGVKNVVKQLTLDNLFEQISRDQYAFNKEGIAQELKRMTHIDSLSHLRRVQTPMDSSIKLTGPRKVNSTQYGYICPLDTPEGALSGLIKNLSIQTSISNFNVNNIIKIKNFFEYDDLQNQIISTHDFLLCFNNYKNYIKIFINSDWLYSYVGILLKQENNQYMFRPDKIYDFFKLMKRNNIIDYDISITWNIIKKEIHFYVDEGRYIRPIYTTNSSDNWEDRLIRNTIEGKANFSDLCNYHKKYNHEDIEICKEIFQRLLTNNIELNSLIKEYQNIEINNNISIEFIDPEESEMSLIAMSMNELEYKNYDYVDIHPSLIFGSLTAMMSFLNHNPCVRATYSHAQSKQSIGIPTTNFNHRFDTKMLVLNYPHKSIYVTKNAELINYNELPTGNNAIVAMCSYLGYNQEDGIVINKDSLDRGMYATSHYVTYHIELDENEELVTPNDIIIKKNKNYNKIEDNNCYVKVGKWVSGNDIVVSKIFKGSTDIDTSVTLEKTPFDDLDENDSIEKHNGGHVVKVEAGKNSDNRVYVKIKICSTSPPEIADKFCSRYANKGVISLTVPGENMPYTKNGIIPDILINAHSIPSRMTLSNLLEIFTGKISAESGYYINGSPFENNNSTFEKDKVGSVMDLLQHYGFENNGNEFMYNGTTGEMMQAKIFIGPAYYQRLKHIVRDKVNARDEGPKDQLTKQPIKGRKRGGGIRIGEMEKDSLVSHGIMNFLKESMLDRSDLYTCIICKLCGKISIYNVIDFDDRTKKFVNNMKEMNCCKFCNNKQYFTQIMLPYCAKLLIQEFETASTTFRLITDDLIH